MLKYETFSPKDASYIIAKLEYLTNKYNINKSARVNRELSIY